MNKITFEKSVDFILITFAILLTNRSLWLCLTDVNDPLSFCSYQNVSVELLLYFFLSIVAMWMLVKKGLIKIIIEKWKVNKITLFFIGFAIISLSWTIYPTGTLYHVLILLFTSLIAAYIGTIYSPKSFLVVLFLYAGITAIASFELLIIFPQAAIMGNPHIGSWRGIYWHKNFTGSLMAFANMITLLYGLTANRADKGRILISAIIYVLSLLFTLFSKSAACIIILVGLNLLIVIVFAWNKIRDRLTKQQYLIASSIAFFISLVAALNLNTLLGLFNRSSNLTGRIPLWEYILTTWVSKRPFLGYGFSAIWHIQEFRNQTTSSQGWPFEITNGHNGFIDIFLGLGIVGVLLALAILIISVFRTGKFILANNDGENFLPFLLVAYFILANLSISFFLEFESFHWMLLLTALFLATPTRHSKPS